LETKFDSLVTLKKSTLEKSQEALQKASQNLQNAQDALHSSYELLNEIGLPQHGSISNMLASRELLSRQRASIEQNKKWVDFASSQLELAKQQLKKDMIEHEKYKYLELEEIQKIIKKQKLQEAKELDEVALITFEKKKIKGNT